VLGAIDIDGLVIGTGGVAGTAGARLRLPNWARLNILDMIKAKSPPLSSHLAGTDGTSA
jgi:hypothetical protein